MTQSSSILVPLASYKGMSFIEDKTVIGFLTNIKLEKTRFLQLKPSQSDLRAQLDKHAMI